MRRFCMVLVVLLAIVVGAQAEPVLTQSPGASLVKKTSTGIFALSHVTHAQGQRTAMALFCAGTFKDIHAHKPGGWLPRKSGPPIKVATKTFDTVLGASGLNKEVSQLPPSTQSIVKTACA